MDQKTLLWAAHKKSRLLDLNLPQENTREMLEDVGVVMWPQGEGLVLGEGAWFVGGWWGEQDFKGGVGGVLWAFL